MAKPHYYIKFEDAFNQYENRGFDIVIGNPPYFNIQTLGHNSIIANYITKNIRIYGKTKAIYYFIFYIKQKN